MNENAVNEVMASLTYLDLTHVADDEVGQLRSDLRSGRLYGHAALVSVFDVVELVCRRLLYSGDLRAWEHACRVGQEIGIICRVHAGTEPPHFR